MITAAIVVTGLRVLWNVLADACARLGSDGVGDDAFKKLVPARVVEPTSKADTVRVWAELSMPSAPWPRTVWRSMARSVKED